MVRTLSKIIMRTKLMTATLNKEENVKLVIAQVQKDDKKFLKRQISDLENAIEDAEEDLSARLSTETAVDKNVVEVMFQGIKDLKTKLELYKEFQTFIKE